MPRRWLTRKLRLLPLLLRLRLLPLRTLLTRHKSFGKVEKQTLPFIRIKSDRLVNKLVGLFFMPVAHLQMGQRAMGRGVKIIVDGCQKHKGGCQRKCFMST